MTVPQLKEEFYIQAEKQLSIVAPLVKIINLALELQYAEEQSQEQYITANRPVVIVNDREPNVKPSPSLIVRPLITAEEARKLGAGNAEWKCNRDNAPWNICTEANCEYAANYLYRAIKQPEPVEPLKQVSWTGSREDVIALLNELGVTK